MNKQKSTPGPWKVYSPNKFGNKEYCIAGTDPKDHEVMVCKLVYEGFEQEANAELIAAAPETAAERDKLKEINKEFLEACKFALAEKITHENPDPIDFKITNMLKQAIKKAEEV